MASNLNLTYEKESTSTATVYAVVWDGAKYSSTGTGTVSKIDRTAPSTPTVNNPTNGNWTNQTTHITVTSSDSGSSISKIEYSYNNSDWLNDWSGNLTTNGNQKTISGNWSAERDARLYFRACDALNNCSSSSNTPIRTDTTPPTFSLGTVSVDRMSAWVPVNSINADISGQKSLTCTGAGSCSCSGNVCKATGLTPGTSYTMTVTLTDNATNTTSKTVTFKTKADPLYDKVNVGDYVRYTPSRTSYTVSASNTGYTSNQTIDPSELNLWRVIKKGANNTIELVSERISTKMVTFYGKEGYKKYIGTLNQLAQSYETSGITSGSRYMGYNGQTENITDETALNKTSAPWTESTTASNSPKGSTREKQGGGDKFYETDVNLVKAACKFRLSNYYYLASRYYYYHIGGSMFKVRTVTSSNVVAEINFSVMKKVASINDHEFSLESYLRPIVVLKTDIVALSGDGTESNPWKVN